MAEVKDDDVKIAVSKKGLRRWLATLNPPQHPTTSP